MIGSLFSGVGGLELGLERATGLSTAWQCEYDRDASVVLAERFSVPNLQDITTVDWADVERVELLCGGPPCQPAGIKCLAEIASGSLLAYAQARGLCARRLLVDMGLSVARGEA